jgi:hypothetical protein
VQLEVPAAAQRSVDHRLLEDDAADGPGRERFGDDVVPREACRSARRDDRRGQHPDRRRFSGAVRAQQADHLARRNEEVYAFHGFDSAGVHLRETFDLDHEWAPLVRRHIRRVAFVNRMTPRTKGM